MHENRRGYTEVEENEMIFKLITLLWRIEIICPPRGDVYEKCILPLISRTAFNKYNISPFLHTTFDCKIPGFKPIRPLIHTDIVEFKSICVNTLK